ncbi:Peptide-N4-(N-acetyl-beta-glucosaminyl)asparagine amidase A [Stylosanthes scabra]|uniref:Peptide-N4-(N-acetyl-beta-glucosaminyl)asparagine amidase A n=1 Tax=Stylosanthes scabra TaxID=79078 RepID=A0ABU6XPR4_9FABA|nr:Peptide-N4-(N-acetyl-beta-glucosaminyl)asparagine amidase A [Stylosanthes scabra]
MANNAVSLLFFIFMLPHFLLQHPISASNLYKLKHLTSDFLPESTFSEDHEDPPPIEFFEVTKPIELPKTKPYSILVLSHDFAYTYGKPPVLANYTLPSDFKSQSFSKIVLEWTATCKGRQFDRIFGVWLGGVELLRSCTAEPKATGIVWTVKKDVTRYHSLLLRTGQTLAVYLGNLVDKTYTGVYHVNVTFHFYPPAVGFDEPKSRNLAFGDGSPADLILPVSRNLPLNDGLWFEIQNSTDASLKKFKIPQNAYRAVLEVYVSFHENDEFWYTNPPNEYSYANNISAGNGPFREVLVSLDDNVVGSVWPFTVIFTGGVNPLLWRPITAIGSFDLPSYDIEVTPFLGSILDGETHSFGFSVTNALNVWYIDANLHLWLDSKCTRTEGDVLEHIAKPLAQSLVSDFTGLNGTFLTNARRLISSTGWVRSSFGNITTTFVQDFVYNNSMVIGNNGDSQTVNQIISFNDSMHSGSSSHSPDFVVDETFRTFLLHLDSANLDQGNDTYLSISNVTQGFDEKKFETADSRLSKSSLKNVQDGQATMLVRNNLVVSGLGETQQDYRYISNGFCYSRKIGSSNYTILYDKVGDPCHRRGHSRFGLGFINKIPAML